jgi:hypothetical protein
VTPKGQHPRNLSGIKTAPAYGNSGAVGDRGGVLLADARAPT